MLHDLSLLALGWREISAQDETCSPWDYMCWKGEALKRLLLSLGTNPYGIWGLKQKLCFLSTMQEKGQYFKKCPKLWARKF